MAGTIALVGGGEFRAPCDEMDRALIELAGGQSARVGIIPTAAARENPRLAAQNGVNHFRRLGASTGAIMIVQRANADSPRFAAQIDDLTLAYLTGGDPVHLLETLRDSVVWLALTALVARGGVLVGSSAGAMILCEQMWALGEGWREGLGAVPRVAIVPHHTTLAARWDTEKMRNALDAGVALVGLDECAGLVSGDGSWRAIGAGEVSVYRDSEIRVYRSGDVVSF